MCNSVAQSDLESLVKDAQSRGVCQPSSQVLKTIKGWRKGKGGKVCVWMCVRVCTCSPLPALSLFVASCMEPMEPLPEA